MNSNKEIKILVCDDSLAMRKIHQKMLEALGYSHCTFAEDGEQGWKEIEQSLEQGELYDLVVCDWMMPHLTGIELLKRVRGCAQTKDLKFLMVTAEKEQHNVLAAVKEGVSFYLVKPFSLEQLKGKIDRVMGQEQ